MIPNVTVPEGARGNWRIERFEVERNSISNLRLAFDGRGCEPGRYTKLVHRERGVVMSDTTAEKRDHRPFIWSATGHVLINGLGLGMCLQAALAKPEVTKATVVELDGDVIGLVADHYTSDPRVEIVHASAFDYDPPKGIRYGAVWHDIWDDICADNLPDMTRLKRKYGRRADWQGCWGETQARRHAREERNRRSWWR